MCKKNAHPVLLDWPVVGLFEERASPLKKQTEHVTYGTVSWIRVLHFIPLVLFARKGNKNKYFGGASCPFP